jgi:hypothetical protein
MKTEITAREKERKVKNALPLVSKAYEQGSFVNEDEKMVHRLAMGLAPNQWLRLEDKEHGARDYSLTSKIDIPQRQGIDLKPIGIWASKGEWYFNENRELTLLEVDYSHILVLTTREDLLAFENEYCKKKMMSYETVDKYYANIKKSRKTLFGSSRYSKSNSRTSGNKNHQQKQSHRSKSKKRINNATYKKLVPICDYAINWFEVGKKYDGIAFVPNPDWFFPWGKDAIENHAHTWLRTFDVASLVIWRQSGGKPIIRAVSLGYIHQLTTEAEKKKVSLDKFILETIKKR